MKNVKFLLLGVFLSSCTHWLIDTETRIQVENNTGMEIYGLSIVSKNLEKFEVLVPDTLEAGARSKVYENEWIGEFKFAVFAKNSPELIDLGVHNLKGGSVLAQIREINGIFAMILK